MSKELNPENLPDIDQAEISNTELIKSIDYTRPLTDYATASAISDFLKKRKKVYDIDLKKLNVNGIVVQDDMENYLQDPSYNSSTLKEALKSPLHLYYERESGWKQRLEKVRKEKAFFSLGTFLHSCILEPAKFNSVLIEPNASRSSLEGLDILIRFWEKKILSLPEGAKLLQKAQRFIRRKKLNPGKYDGKKIYLEQIKKLSGRTAVTAEQKIIIDAVKFNYHRYGGGILPHLLKGAKTEVSMYYTDPATGIPVRIRPDALQTAENIGHNTIISVKSTACENLGHFYYQSAKLLYELAEGMYLSVAEAVTNRSFTCVITLMLQTVPPFGVAALVWNAEDIEIGKYKYRQALQTVVDCENAGKYPGYDVYAEEGNLGFIDMKQPEWNAKELFPTDIED